MTPPTLRDVAHLAGVHPATVSRALNPATRALVNADTARKVLEAAESLGYQPNPIARSLKTAKSRTVGVVIPDLTNPLFPPIVRGIEDVLSPAGYNAYIVNTDNDPAREEAQVESLRSRQVEGLIVATARREHPMLLRLHAVGMRMVLVNRQVDDLEVPVGDGDDATGIELAVAHLAALGTSPDRAPRRPARHLDRRAPGPAPSGTRCATTTSRGPPLVAECTHWSEAAGARALAGLLDAGVGFTAVVAGNDLLALGCYDVFAERGLSCPRRRQRRRVQRDAVPRQDRTAADDGLDPALRVGFEAGRLLLDAIEGPYRPARSVLLPVSLIVRRSTAAPRG